MSGEIRDAADEQRLVGLTAYASFFHNTESGRLILADLKKNLDRPTFRPGMNPNETLWLEGRRSVYLDIVASVGAGIEAIENVGRKREPTLAPVLDGPID